MVARRSARATSAHVPVDGPDGVLPSVGAGSVARQALLDVLEAPAAVAVFAPLGFGKTTLLVQHARRQRRPVVWITLDEHDDDPVLLISKIVASLERVAPVDRGLRRAVAAPGASVWAGLVPRLVAALADAKPCLLVFDDVHAVSSEEVFDVITWLALQSPSESQVIVAGRADAGSQLGRLRVSRDVLEIGPEALAFTDAEAAGLLLGSGIAVSDVDAATLNARCEGWPAGLRLAALSHGDHDDARLSPFPGLSGRDRVVADYVRTELLATLAPEQAEFMLQTSALHRLSPALCDFVLRRSGSGTMLRVLERSNAFITAIDREEHWYRCHDLVRETLISELERQEPAMPSEYRRRAAEWHAANQLAVEAVHYRQDAGDDAATVRMMAFYLQEEYGRGHTSTIMGWTRWAEERDLLAADPDLAVSAALVCSINGEPQRAMRFARALDASDGDPASGSDRRDLRALQAMIRAYFCERDASEALVDAQLALRTIPKDDRWHRPACLALGLAHIMDGDAEAADAVLSEIAVEGMIEGIAPNARAAGLGLRARSALESGDLDQARSYLTTGTEVRRIGALEGQGLQALQDALLARLAIAEGRHDDGHELLRRAQKLRHLLTWAVPSVAVITRLELAKVHLALADAPGARALVLEIQDILHMRPRLGVLIEEVDSVRSQLAEVRGGTAGVSTLTGAELRLVPMLATHLTFAEIGRRLGVSDNTVKSQAMSVYRKLDATSRGEAVRHAVRAGLIDPAAVTAIVLASGLD